MSTNQTFATVSPTTVTNYSIIYYAITVLNLIVTPIYMYSVIFKSKSTMSSFKKLLIAGMPFLIFSTAIISFTIPIYVYETRVYQLHGLIHGTSEEVTVAITTAGLVCDQINSDLLLVMLINRYQILSSDFVEHSRYFYPGIYAFLAVTNIMQSSLIVINLVLEPLLPFLKTSILANTNFFIITSGVILITRIYAHIKVFLLNRRFAMAMHSMVTPATLQLHKMLFRAVLSNVLVTLVPKLMYLALIIAVIINQSTIEIMINIISIFHNITYIAEMMITLYFVRPYREFVASLFRNGKTQVEVLQSDTRES